MVLHRQQHSDARDEAKRILAEKTLGKHRPRSIAWEDALKGFFDDAEQRVKEDNLRVRTLSDYTRLLKKHFAFGRRQLSEVSSEEIARRLARLSDAPSERNHALVALKVFLRWTQKAPRRYIDHSPCEGRLIKQLRTVEADSYFIALTLQSGQHGFQEIKLYARLLRRIALQFVIQLADATQYISMDLRMEVRKEFEGRSTE
jgi:hypothetical protein